LVANGELDIASADTFVAPRTTFVALPCRFDARIIN